MFNKKRDHFKKVKKVNNEMLWELEFTKFSLLDDREALRTQYDKLSMTIEGMTEQLKLTPNDKKMETSKLSFEKQRDSIKDELDMFDAKLNGGPPTVLLPKGVPVGVDDRLRETVLRNNKIERFITYNC